MANKPAEAIIALTTKQAEMMAARGEQMPIGELGRRRGLVVANQPSGRQMIHTLWRMQDRDLGQEKHEAIRALERLEWLADDYEGIL
eukprot:13472735-Alexandrium_andersonii.AAC.1